MVSPWERGTEIYCFIGQVSEINNYFIINVHKSNKRHSTTRNWKSFVARESEYWLSAT